MVLITDYDGDDQTTRQLTTRLAAHNDVLAVLVYDPLGVYLPASGEMQATDGTQRVAVPGGRHFAAAFAARLHFKLARRWSTRTHVCWTVILLLLSWVMAPQPYTYVEF